MVILSISGALLWQIQHRPKVSPIRVYGDLADFQLTERTGRSFGSSDLKGHVWIADFMFTRCAGPCPMMAVQMAHLQEDLKDVPSVRLVSISVDPDHDTPAVLSDYARNFQADRERWLFLTGKTQSVRDLAMQHFRLATQMSPNPNAVLHSTHFVLVDGRQRIRGYYDSADSLSVKQLEQDVRRLVEETP